MKKKPLKKLRLNRETLQSLTDSKLREVNGGCLACTVGCPATENMVNSCAYCVIK